ncbi:hypothetical protein [Cronobacter dublinensis]|uniref:hypothetical protein n=1 Tax=Cronobacter dublinensis TaxID=413497 RepID=UPI000CFC701A|nr:hypothetical protein [Cronobacter dublinensis]
MDKIYFWGWYSDYDCHTIVNLKKYYNVKNVSMTKLVRIIFKALKFILPAKAAEKIIRTALLSKIDKDSVVLFSDDILYYMNFALSLMNKRKIIVFRNIIPPKYESDIQLLKKAGFEMYTFDPSDACHYNICYKGQYLPVYNVDEVNPGKTAYFLGLNKGRKEILERLSCKLIEKDVTVSFTIVDNPSKKISLSKKSVSYRENIHNVLQSRFIVDIVRPGQSGLTLRVLESAFYKRKLITNNPSVKNTDLYNPNNILVLDEQMNIPDEFLASPYEALQEVVLEKYKSDNYYIDILEGAQCDKNI